MHNLWPKLQLVGDSIFETDTLKFELSADMGSIFKRNDCMTFKKRQKLIFSSLLKKINLFDSVPYD